MKKRCRFAISCVHNPFVSLLLKPSSLHHLSATRTYCLPVTLHLQQNLLLPRKTIALMILRQILGQAICRSRSLGICSRYRESRKLMPRKHVCMCVCVSAIDLPASRADSRIAVSRSGHLSYALPLALAHLLETLCCLSRRQETRQGTRSCAVDGCPLRRPKR